MRAPKWIPQVRRPWNPAYREVWDAMSPDERRWSFLFDALIAVVCIGLIIMGIKE